MQNMFPDRVNDDHTMVGRWLTLLGRWQFLDLLIKTLLIFH